MVKHVAIAASLVMTTLFPGGAQAQDRVGLALAAGVIAKATPPPQEGCSEPVYLFSVQRVMKRYFVLDGDLHYWAHTSRFDRGPHNLSGPGGVIGHVERSTEISDNTYWNLGLNFLVKSTGAVRVNRGTGRAGTPARSPEYGSRSNEPGGGSSEPPGHRHNHDHNQDQAAE